jgi:hypothetical protein
MIIINVPLINTIEVSPAKKSIGSEGLPCPEFKAGLDIRVAGIII